MVFRRVFHDFLPQSRFALWIWLESDAYSSTPAFFAHDHQIAGRLVHSLWARQRFYPSLFAYYPQLPQASTATTIFI
jgi:hypothetical protein